MWAVEWLSMCTSRALLQLLHAYGPALFLGVAFLRRFDRGLEPSYCWAAVLTHLWCLLPPGRYVQNNDKLATLQANAFNGLSAHNVCVTNSAQNAATHMCLCC